MFVTVTQVASLKHTPVLFDGHDSPVMRGEEVVYLPPDDINVGAEIAAGRLQNGIRILDSRMCTSPVMREYWKGLDCKELQEADLLEENIKAYLAEQEKYLRQEISQNDFVAKQEGFVKSICAIRVDDWKNKYPALLELLKTKMLLLEKKSLALKKPSELTLGTVYKPRCEHEKFGLELAYVHDGFAVSSMVDQVRTFLVEIDVNNCFAWGDAGFFSSHPEFCKYFWSEYLPTITHSFSEKWIEHLSSVPSLLSQTGEVRKPYELYSPELSGQLGEQSSWRCHLPDFSGFGEKAMHEAIRLSLKSIPFFNDIIDYLLTSSADKALALEWLAKYETLTPEETAKVGEYRESPNACWENNRGDLCQIKHLVTIGFANSDDAKALSGHPRVLRIRGLGKAEIREKALRHLGVKIVSDKDLIPEHIESSDQRDVFRTFLPGLFVYVACREGDGWHEVFMKYKEELAKFLFVRCDKIGLHYEDMRLENRHFCRSEKNHELYYVGEPQGRRVFESMVRAIREWLEIRGDIEELKDVFDPETNLDIMLIERCRGLLEDETFMAELKKVSPSIYNKVQMRLFKATTQPMKPTTYIETVTGVTTDHITQEATIPSQEPQSKDESDKKGNDLPKEKHKAGAYELDDEEYEELSRLFEDGLTGEGSNNADERKKDESKLACLRLFKYLESKKLEPSMDGHRDIKYVVTNLYHGLGKTGPNIDVNTGERWHVISAMGGVAYIPPRWWQKIVNNENGMNVICAVTGVTAENFRVIRGRSDVAQYVSDNAVPIKIRGRDADERIDIVSHAFCLVDSDATAGKIYALLKLRDNTSMNSAFARGYCSDEMSEFEASHNDDL